MKRRNLAAVTAAATAAAVIPAAGAMAASAGHDGRTVLANSGVVHAQGLRVQAAAPSSQQMSVTLQLPLRNQELAQQLYNRGVVLSTAQYRAYFSPSKAQLAKVARWATSQGFTVSQASRDSGQVTVRTTVSRVNRAFHVRLHRATLNGARGLTTDAAPSVPSSLGLSGVAGLNTVHRMQTEHAKQPHSRRASLRPTASSSKHMTTGGIGVGGPRTGLRPSGHVSPHADGTQQCAFYWGDHLYPSASVFTKESNYICGYIPQDLVQMYKAKTANNKAPGIGILLWGNDPNMKTLTNDYMTQAGYPLMTKYTPTVAKPNSHMADCGPEGVKVEQSIDVQSSHSIAPNSHIYYYGAASCYDQDLTAMLQKAVDQHKVSTISMSFGSGTDAGMNASDVARWNRPLLQAALTGISVFASSGDSGNNSTAEGNNGQPGVGFPASSAYLTAVGGTSVGLASSGALDVQAGWEDRFFLQASPASTSKSDVTSLLGISGAGGGVSAVSGRPSWQNGKVTFSGSKRAVPDIAGIADPYTGFRVNDENGFETYGGTSLASPVVAAVSAIAKAKNGAKLGNLAPLFYKLAGSSAIKDINLSRKAGVYFPSQSGTYNLVGFDAKPQNLVSAKGWDSVTGVGVPGGTAFYSAIK